MRWWCLVPCIRCLEMQGGSNKDADLSAVIHQLQARAFRTSYQSQVSCCYKTASSSSVEPLLNRAFHADTRCMRNG
jgi:hypothetical protein